MDDARAWLKALRGKQGLTQPQAAAKAGISFRGYQKIELGWVTPKPKTKQRIADALGFDVSLFGERPGKAKQPKKPTKEPKKLNRQKKTAQPTNRLLELSRDNEIKEFQQMLGKYPKPKENRNILTVKKDGTVQGSYWEWMRKTR